MHLNVYSTDATGIRFLAPHIDNQNYYKLQISSLNRLLPDVMFIPGTDGRSGPETPENKGLHADRIIKEAGT